MKTAKVTLAGREYELTPPGKEELRLLDAYVLKNRRSVLQLAKDNLEGLSPELQQSLLRDALKMEASRSASQVSAIEYSAVLDTREGAAYLFWLMMRRSDPSVTLDHVQQAIVDASDQEFERLLEERDAVQGDEQEESADGRGEPSGGEPAADPVGG